jgi:hypothetical protein
MQSEGNRCNIIRYFMEEMGERDKGMKMVKDMKESE